MKNVMTIFRRDFLAYFKSPVGYIFMIVFLLFSVGLFMTPFFAFPVADMRGFFANLPLLLCVFVPAVTMRVWAEERKENTWEMLLTFPMRARELVLGKFFAALAFFVITIAATATVPLMLAVLGDPDSGAILGGYLGTLLMGAFFLSMGIFFSGLCRDQIVSFVVTLLACFGIFLVGTDFVANQVNNFIGGFGTFLSDAVGLMDHYDSFTRGVVDFADVLYFLAWTVLFLFLNILFIEGRNRRGARTVFVAAVALCVAIGLLFNWLLVGQSLGRIDMTEDKIYTVSPATQTILSKATAPVQVELYITPRDEMPTSLSRLEQDIKDKLEELRIASGGKLQYRSIPMRAANVIRKATQFGEEEEDAEEDDASKAIEERMLDKGVAPFQVRAVESDQVTSKLVYSSIGVAYKDKEMEMIPQVVPDSLQELEYRIVNIVYKLVNDERPVVALVAPKDAIPPEMRQIYMQLGQPVPESVDPYEKLQQWLEVEKYDVRRVAMTKEDPLPEQFDTLVIIKPQDLNERQRWEVARALRAGKSVVLAVQQYEWDYRVQRNQLTLNQNEIKPGVNELLEKMGLKVSDQVLMDANHVPLNISSGGDALSQLLGMSQPVDLPTHVLVTSEGLSKDYAVTNWLSTVLYLWGTALEIDEARLGELGLDHLVLMTSSSETWTIPGDADGTTLSEALNREPAAGEPMPLMAMVSGTFPDPFEGQERPAWPPAQPMPGQPPMPPDDIEEAPAAPVEPAPGKLILIGCGAAFTDSLLGGGLDNLDLMLNSVDAVSLGEDLVNVRGKRPVNRTIARPDTRTRVLWKTVNYAGANVAIALIGIAIAVQRRRSRNAYTMSFARQND
jgi:ABC-2 type transport system permease protein